MNIRAFALIKDLELVLPRYQEARAEFERVSAGPRAVKDAALGEVIVRVNDVLAAIRRHEDAFAQ